MDPPQKPSSLQSESPLPLNGKAFPPSESHASSSLQMLPEGVLFDVLSRLPPEEIASKISPLSRSFRALAGNPLLWQHFCGGGITEQDAHAAGGWKHLFKRVFRTNLLCCPHFELLDSLQKEQEVYDLEPFEPTSNSHWSLWDRQSDDYIEGNVGADAYWFNPLWKWTPWFCCGGGTRWKWGRGLAIRELRPVGCPPCPGAEWAPCIATGHHGGVVEQRVGLKKFPTAFLNSRPALLVSAWYAGRSDCPSAFDLSVELTRGPTGDEILFFWSASGCTRRSSEDEIDASRMLRTPQGGWTKVEHLITDYPEGVEEIRVTLSGIDCRIWAGWYGAKFTAVELRFVPPGEIHKYRQQLAAD